MRQAKKGVTIHILIATKTSTKQLDNLIHAGIAVHHAKLYIHAKVFILDQQKTLLGSINMTRNSLDKNRELAIISTDRNIIKLLNQTFAADWQSSVPLSVTGQVAHHSAHHPTAHRQTTSPAATSVTTQHLTAIYHAWMQQLKRLTHQLSAAH